MCEHLEGRQREKQNRDRSRVCNRINSEIHEVQALSSLIGKHSSAAKGDRGGPPQWSSDSESTFWASPVAQY